MRHLLLILFLLTALELEGAVVYLPATGSTGDIVTATNIRSTPYTFPSSGITLSNVVFTNGYWGSGGAINAVGLSNINIINCTVLGTNNGTGLATTNSSVGVYLQDCAWVNILYNNFRQFYVRIPGCGEASGISMSPSVYIYPIQLFNTGHDININSNYLSDGENMISGSGFFQNLNIISNKMSAGCIQVSVSGIPTSPNQQFGPIIMKRNSLDNWAVWSASPPANGPLHLDGAYFSVNQAVNQNGLGCIVTNIQVVGNYFGPNVVSTTNNTTTAPFYTQFTFNTNMLIYPIIYAFNEVSWTNTLLGPDSKQMYWNSAAVSASASDTNYLVIANNTVHSLPTFVPGTGYFGVGKLTTISGNGSYRIFNNWTMSLEQEIIWNAGGPGVTNYPVAEMIDNNTYTYPWSYFNLAYNYSVYRDFMGPDSSVSQQTGLGVTYQSWVGRDWFCGTNAVRFDQHNSSTNLPAYNPLTFRPYSGSSLLTGGSNLYSITGPIEDRDGISLPSSGPWPVGAYSTTNSVAANVFNLYVVNGTGTGTYTNGQQVTITTNNTIFAGWSDLTYLSGNTPTATLTMPSNTYTITANYTNATATGTLFLIDLKH